MTRYTVKYRASGEDVWSEGVTRDRHASTLDGARLLLRHEVEDSSKLSTRLSALEAAILRARVGQAQPYDEVQVGNLVHRIEAHDAPK